MFAGVAAGDDRRRAAWPASAPRCSPPPRWPACRASSRASDARAAAMGLFGAIDDLGLTAGPALAALALAVVSPTTLMALNAVSFAVSAAADRGGRDPRRGRRAAAPRATTPVRRRPRRRPRARRAARRSGRCSAPRPPSCSASASPTSARSCSRARSCDVGGSGLAVMVDRRRPRHRRSARSAPASPRPARGPGAAPTCSASPRMAVELLACARPALLLARRRRRSRSAASATASRSSTTACCSPRSTPESLHGRLFGLQKTCISLAFALSFLAGGALIAADRRPDRVPRLAASACSSSWPRALPRLRAAWPAPPARSPPALGDALA